MHKDSAHYKVVAVQLAAEVAVASAVAFAETVAARIGGTDYRSGFVVVVVVEAVFVVAVASADQTKMGSIGIVEESWA